MKNEQMRTAMNYLMNHHDSKWDGNVYVLKEGI